MMALNSMQKITRDKLYSLEKYDAIRGKFRDEVMAHKQNRRLPIGPNATLYFEDTLTIQYQVQEMLRIERIFEAEAIQQELDVYNPLIRAIPAHAVSAVKRTGFRARARRPEQHEPDVPYHAHDQLRIGKWADPPFDDELRVIIGIKEHQTLD